MAGEGLQRVLDALDRAHSTWTRQATGYMARCPTHDDRKASLSITAGIDKNGNPTVFLCCQTGCETQLIMDALHLQWTDLYDDDRPDNRAQRTIVATHDYRNATGTLLYQKVRYLPKDFRVRRPVGNGDWLWNLDKNTPRVLYRLPEIIAAVHNNTTIYICEGEKDVDRLVALGYEATCNFDGASQGKQRPKWRNSYSDVLIGATVIIIADNDEAGFAHSRHIATSLTGKATSITLVRGAVNSPHADVSNHLDAGHTLTELIQIPLSESPSVPQVATNGHREGSITVTEPTTENEPPTIRRLRPTRASEIALKRVRWLWENRILLGGLTLLAGREGLGKSTVAVDLTAQVTRGELPGEMLGTPATVIYINSEDARDDTIVPRLTAAGADLDRVVFLDAMTSEDIETAIVLPFDTDLLAAAVEEHNAVLVVLDAATSVIDGRLDGDKDRQMRQALEAIARKVGQETGCAVLGIVHFGKRDSNDTGKLILGSIAWSQVARSTLAVAQDTDTGQLVITGSKANLAPGNTPSLAARIISATVVTDEGPASVGRVEWLGETDSDARDLLDPDALAGRAERNEARDWLHDYLSTGRVKSSDAKKAATAAGISERTLQRARSQLKVKITAAGFPRVSYWSLPALPHQTAPHSGASRANSPNTPVSDHKYSAYGTTGSTDDDLGKHTGTTSGTTVGTTVAQLDSGSSTDQHSCATPVVPRHNCVTSGNVSPASGANEHVARARVRSAPAREPDLDTWPTVPPPSDVDDPVMPGRHLNPVYDPEDDHWVHCHLTTTPQTIAQLVTDLDVTPATVEAALKRLAKAEHAQHHPSRPGVPAGWSLPTRKEHP